jgi:hypothetical protein
MHIYIYSNWSNPSRQTTALGYIQPLTEMITRHLPGGKKLLACKDNNLISICEPIL